MIESYTYYTKYIVFMINRVKETAIAIESSITTENPQAWMIKKIAEYMQDGFNVCTKEEYQTHMIYLKERYGPELYEQNFKYIKSGNE